MKLSKILLATVLTVTMVASLASCGSTPKTEADRFSNYNQDSESLTFDNSAWNYDTDHDVYWQISVGYCATPETTDYETMGIYVPGKYMTAIDNGDGTYTCEINEEGKVGNYTAKTAPIVFPVNTAGYSAQAAPTEYSYDGLSSYLDAGFIYVYAGMRGRDNGYDDGNNLTYSGGAPWGVTDLKAAIRYYRFNQSTLPGDADNIFTFGMSGGGAQSAITGASGDSELYYQYLESIGAAMYDENKNYISDAVAGSMCWCPITSLDYADEAYEWNLGQYFDTDTRADSTWTSALSDDLANAFAEYINKLGLKDENGNVLTLEKTTDGIYTSGTYYDYLRTVVETSLNNFLSDTTFPYTPSNSFNADGGFGGGVPSGGMTGAPPDGVMGGTPPDGAAGGAPSQTTETVSTTYETAQDYIDSLNSDTEWITYDAATNTAAITSMEAFATHCKSASKSVGAFDDLQRGQAENNVFGNDENDSLHFDSVMAALLETNQEAYSAFSDWDSSLVDSFANDLTETDKLGSTIQERLNMYNPMYYLSDYYDGYGASTPAKYWRIRTGIEQGDTALTVETNLALALENYEGVNSVDFETVWGQGHTLAERTGDSTSNFISWVEECTTQ